MTARAEIPPVIHYTDPRTREKVLHEPYTIRWRDLTLTIPKGFRWDGASVPRIVRSLIDNDDCSEAGALGHDAIYKFNGYLPVDWIRPLGRVVSRLEGDQLLRDFMELEERPEWKEAAVYQGVRRFGWYAWWQNGRRARTSMHSAL